MSYKRISVRFNMDVDAERKAWETIHEKRNGLVGKEVISAINTSSELSGLEKMCIRDSIQIHMNEGPDEDKCCVDKYGMTTAELYKKIGFWEGGKAWANQCSCMEPVELNIMGQMGVGISTQPRSNALCNAGIAPVADMLKN